jgi:hypothetical protein
LSKLAPEEQEDAKGHLLRHKDYTVKTQSLAEERRQRERDLIELEQWRGWRRGAGSQVEQQLEELERLKQQVERQPAAEPGTYKPSGRRYDATPEDFFEAERLHKTLDGLEEGFLARASERWKQDYEQHELPRIDRLAGNYVNTVVGLLELIWPENQPKIPDLLRQAAASQNKDLRAVAKQIIDSRDGQKKAGFEEGYERAKKEMSQHAPPAPSGAQMPVWRRPAPTGRKQGADLFNEVMSDVQNRRGALPY